MASDYGATVPLITHQNQTHLEHGDDGATVPLITYQIKPTWSKATMVPLSL
jgi:hypothetical protein